MDHAVITGNYMDSIVIFNDTYDKTTEASLFLFTYYRNQKPRRKNIQAKCLTKCLKLVMLMLDRLLRNYNTQTGYSTNSEADTNHKYINHLSYITMSQTKNWIIVPTIPISYSILHKL